MNSELSSLIRLQQLDLNILELQERISQIPDEIAAFDQTLEEQRQSVDELNGLIKEGNKQRRLIEGETEVLQQQLAKYKSQLMEVKTNKEYQAVLHEIENTNQEIAAKEDQILEGMMAMDEWEEKSSEAGNKLAEQEKELSKKRAALESFELQARNDIDHLEKERSQFEKETPEQLIRQYEKIASARNGTALAEARDQSCQACHVKLRPQLFNDIKTNQQIITCESCNRILYYVEN